MTIRFSAVLVRIAAVVFLCLAAQLAPVLAADSTATTGSIAGRVVDALSGFPLEGAAVAIVGSTPSSVVSGPSGRFRVDGLNPGQYTIRIQYPGYQTTLSDPISIAAGVAQDVTLSLLRAAGGQGVRTLGRTTIRASQSLQRSSIVVKQASVETIERAGVYRLGDYLRTVPQVNLAAATGGTDTPSPGDDMYFDIRGIGGLEAVALIDGHPIGFGINRGKNVGFNFETSPTFALRTVQVVYGSGVAGLTPYSSVGGTIDMLTLEPTTQAEANFTQGWGTFNKLVTTFNATGTAGRLGYAVALGTQGIDGPYKSNFPFQPAAAFDPSTPAGNFLHDVGVYKDDTAVVNRGDFLKLRYALGNMIRPAHITLSAVNSYYWDDKTGNGDQDFAPYDYSLALAQNALANFSGSCPAGTYTPTNLNGAPWGTGPDGSPDGGLTCVTPQQAAVIQTGLQGAGTTFQTFTMADYNFKYDQPVGSGTLALSAYTNRWFQLYDRTYQLPFISVPGDNPFWVSPQVNTTGGSLTDMFNSRNNDIGFGLAYNNYAYLFKANQTKPILSGASVTQPSPVVHDDELYMQDVYHPESSPLTTYFNAAEAHSTITNTTYFDPRLALVYNLPHNNVARFATGITAIQPYASYVDLPFSPVAIGAINYNCGGLSSIGQVANPNLLPEKANDQELSFGHSFQGGSQVQLTVYTENVPSKIFATLIPAFGLPPNVIDAATFAAYETAINSHCGTSGPGGVGVFSQANVGRLLAQGLDLNGRQHFSRQLFVDYGYTIESSALRAADVVTLQNNPTLIVGSQLPGVPIHKGSIALDATLFKNIDFRLTQTFVSAGNTKNASAYNYGDFVINAPVKQYGTVNIGISNVFNQQTSYLGYTGTYNGQFGHGLPLPLNQFSSGLSAYQPLVGSAATELFGLSPRQVFISYTYHAR